MKRRKDEEFAVSNIERQKPDRQTRTIFPHRMRNTRVKFTYEVGVEPVAVPPIWVGGST